MNLVCLLDPDVQRLLTLYLMKRNGHKNCDMTHLVPSLSRMRHKIPVNNHNTSLYIH